MPRIGIIAAIEENNGIGLHGDMPWGRSYPEDLKHFANVTRGLDMIMGRRTYESLPGVLPGRRSIVITSRPLPHHELVLTVRCLQEAIEKVRTPIAYIIGGAQVYRDAMHIADRLDITHIDKSYPADTFFPEIDPNTWTATSTTPGEGLRFVTYERKMS